MRHLDDCDGGCESRPEEANCAVMAALLDHAAADQEVVPTMCPLCKGDGKNVDPGDGELVDCNRCAGSGSIAVPVVR